MSSKDTRSDQVRRFVAALYEPADLIESRLIPNRADAPAEGTAATSGPATRPTVQSRWFRAEELTGPTALAWMKAANDRGFGVYVGANPRKPKGKTASGVALARSLFVDFDGNAEPSAALARIRAAGLPAPSAVILSGHGVHTYWRLEEPLADLARWTRLQKSLIARLGSDKAIHDPPRVMRVPGFTNHKSPAAPCELVSAEATLRYSVEAFAEPEGDDQTPPHGAPARPRTPLRPVPFADAVLSPKTLDFLARGAKGGTRHNRLIAAVNELAGCHVDRAEAEAALTAAAMRSGLAQPEVAKTIADGYAKPRTPTVPQVESTEWTPPTPLSRSGEVMPFPIDRAFPPGLAPIRRFVAGVAQSVQVPVDLPAMLVIPFGMLAIAHKARLRIGEDWSEPAAFWSVVAMDPGTRKSSAFAMCAEPLSVWESEEAARLAPVITQAKERREWLTSQHKHLHATSKRDRRGSQPGNEAAASALAREIAEIDVPEPPRLLVSDATPEAIAANMVKCGERAILASPEGDALDVMLGRYNDRGSPNLGIYLKGYGGEPETILRRGHDPIRLRSALLSMAMAVQPRAICALLASADARGRGLVPRFQFSVPASLVGDRKPHSEATRIDPDAKAEYARSLRRLLDLPLDAERGPVTIRLGPEAAYLFDQFERRHEPSLRADGELGDRPEWGSKLPGVVGRLALLFHCWERWGIMGEKPGEPCPVSGDSMSAALAWVPYLAAHFSEAHAVARTDPSASPAARIRDWIARNRLTTFTKRNAFDQCRCLMIQVVDDVEEPLTLLEKHGYILPEPTPSGFARPGRPPSQRYIVNPLFLSGTVSPA